MSCVYVERAVQFVLLRIFSTGGKFKQVSNFTELHPLTLATRSYVLLSLAVRVV